MAGGIWVGMMLLSFAYAVMTGNAAGIAGAAMEGAKQAVELSLAMLGVHMLWMGLMRIAEDSGLSKKISALLSHPLRHIFRGVKPGGKAMGAICMNVSANVLGMGNAATPLGLFAMEELSELNGRSERASDAMAMLIVLNSSSVQLIPTAIIALRAAAGSAAPESITGAVIAATGVSTIAGVLSAKLMEKRS